MYRTLVRPSAKFWFERESINFKIQFLDIIPVCMKKKKEEFSKEKNIPIRTKRPKESSGADCVTLDDFEGAIILCSSSALDYNVITAPNNTSINF